MRIRSCFAGAVVFLFICSAAMQAQAVRFKTTLGDIDVQLLPDSAPNTVANFLNYVKKGAYNNSFFHRSVPGFIIQGGGYTFANGKAATIPEDAAIVNEYRVTNTRGTLAMAKSSNGPNTATDQWFFNLSNNNASILNSTNNGGFTVFGRVTNNASLAVMDAIAAAPVYAVSSTLQIDACPLINYTGGTVTDSNIIFVSNISILETPSVSDGGIATAGAFGAFPYATPGSFIEIYGSKLGPEIGRTWGGSDFVNGNAPISLDGVSVTIGGLSAYVYYVSPGQINVQVPAAARTTGTVPVIVTYAGLSSPAVQLTMKPAAPGVLAPPSFKLDDKQFVAALHANNTLVTRDSPALPNETIVIYGTGFGPVTPSTTPIAGRVVTVSNSVFNPVVFKIGGTEVKPSYAGLAPQQVGLYQFNVTVPAGTPAGDATMSITLGTDTVPQTLFLSVGQAQ